MGVFITRAIRRRLCALPRDQKGNVAIEFALILPVLLIILLGIVQFGFMFAVHNAMADAAREGARAMAIRQLDSAEAVSTTRDALARWNLGFDIQADAQQDPGGRTEFVVVVSLQLAEIAFGDYLGTFAGRRIETVSSMREE